MEIDDGILLDFEDYCGQVNPKDKLIQEFREHSWSRLGAGECNLWLLLWTFTDVNGEVTVCDTTLARYSGVTVRGIEKQRKTLVARGLLERLAGGYTGTASTYRLYGDSLSRTKVRA